MTTPVYRDEKGSFLQFGGFEPSCYYDIENSPVRGHCNKSRSVEFVLQLNEKILFVEAKKTSPNLSPQDEKSLRSYIKDDCISDFEKFISHRNLRSSFVVEIVEKFVSSFFLSMGIANGYLTDTSMPKQMLEFMRKKDLKVVFLLVITDSKPDWAENISRRVQSEMGRIFPSSFIKVQAITAEMAMKKKIVNQIYPH